MTAVADERVWLSREIDGTLRYFHCPVAAVEGWQEMGWQPSEAPPEPPNPATAHLLAAQAPEPAPAEPPAKAKPKTTNKSADGGSESQE